MSCRALACAFLLLAAGAPPTAAQRTSPAPSLVLLGGKIFTADARHPWAQAVAIRGERILRVGANDEIARLATPSTRRIDLGGRVVVPGFNDAHDHVGAPDFGAGFAMGTAPNADPALAQVLDSLRSLSARTPPGTWLHTAVGQRTLEDPAATRETLDRVAPEHPVLLWGWTGHEALLNGAALRALRIDEDVRDPLGGHYGRDAGGHLNGMLTNYAEWAALRRLYSAQPETTLVAGVRRYADEGVRLGITSVQDMDGYFDPATTERVFRSARLPIRLRVIPYPMTDTAGLLPAEWGGISRRPAPLTVISGVKWVLDGTPIERGSLMRAPYADRPGWHGELLLPVAMVRAILAHALATREPLHLHITGDSTPRLVFALMHQLAPDSAWRGLRVRFEHGDWVTGDLLPEARRLGIVIVQNPTHFALDGALLQRRLGHAPVGIMPERSLLAAGVPLALGSDGPRNPFVNLMFAITHPLAPTEALTREQAVTAYTRGSAYAELEEGEKGTLAPGMLADLAVLSQDIFTIPPQALPTTRSLLTIVGGQVVWNELARADTRGGVRATR